MEGDHPFIITGASLEVPNNFPRDRRNSNENNNIASMLHSEPVEDHMLQPKTEDQHALRRKSQSDEFFRSRKPPKNVDDLHLNEDLTVSDAILGPRFRNFFSDVSVVGLKYVALGGVSWLRRVIWLVLVLMGLGFMIFQVSGTFILVAFVLLSMEQCISDLLSCIKGMSKLFFACFFSDHHSDLLVLSSILSFHVWN